MQRRSVNQPPSRSPGMLTSNGRPAKSAMVMRLIDYLKGRNITALFTHLMARRRADGSMAREQRNGFVDRRGTVVVELCCVHVSSYTVAAV